MSPVRLDKRRKNWQNKHENFFFLNSKLKFHTEKNMGKGQMFAAELEREAVSTAKMLERVPDDLSWTPHEKSMNLGTLASHVALLPTFVKAALTADGFDLATKRETPTLTTGAELAAAFQAGVNEAVELLINASDEDLAKIWRLSNGEKVVFELPRFAVIRTIVLNHLLHHRGQLSVYLRLNDVPLPSVYGPSADEAI
jgi:uncharacterized damage-inducible protein DinB